MHVQSLGIEDVKLILPDRHGDDRGVFSETYNNAVFRNLGIETEFVQDNQVETRKAHTLRGFHFQTPPFAQAKLVRVLRGKIVDIVVDIRLDSPTFGESVRVELDNKKGAQLLVPIGFAHAYVTLEPETEVLYKVSNYYSPDHEAGLIWNDPDVNADWPIEDSKLVLSDRDRHWPRLKAVQSPFIYAFDRSSV